MFLIITTYPTATPKKVKQFIFELIGSKLAKCVNKIPYIKSTFFWEGKIQSSKEVLLIIKAKKENKDGLIKFIKSKHPYEVPEIIVLSPEDVENKYLEWIRS